MSAAEAPAAGRRIDESWGETADRGSSGTEWGWWERARAEERAEQMRHVVQDTVRAAHLAEALAGSGQGRDPGPSR